MNGRVIAGVDEVGIGPLAGEVVAAAVILPDDHQIEGITDSKKLSEKKRERLYDEITQTAIAWALGTCTVAEIDQMNILQAALLAMQRAVQGLSVRPDKVLVDGKHAPELGIPTRAIIGGDSLVTEISAASIIAKVTRDRSMVEYEQQYPGYGFAQHKGYGTKQHRHALEQLGASPIHRTSFAPVRQVLGLEKA